MRHSYPVEILLAVGGWLSHADETEKLLTVGESKADPAVPRAELAAWTMVVNQLMNLDETLNK